MDFRSLVYEHVLGPCNVMQLRCWMVHLTRATRVRDEDAQEGGARRGVGEHVPESEGSTQWIIFARIV